MDQYGLARTSSSFLEESSIGGGVGDVNSGSLFERNLLRESVERVLVGHELRGIGSGNVARGPDSVPDLPLRDLVSDSLDHSSGISSGSVGQAASSNSSSDVSLHGIHSHGSNSHQNLV